MNADELRKQLRDERNRSNSDGQSGETSTDTFGYFATDNSTAGSVSAAKERSANSSSAKVRGVVKSVLGQAGGTSGNDQPTTNIEGKLAGGIGSTAQVDRRARQEPRRHGENSATDRADGINISASTTTSQTRKRVGNLERDTANEPFIPTRTFENGAEESTKTETVTASPAIEKSKRGRPPGKRIIEAAKSAISHAAEEAPKVKVNFSLPTPRGKRLSEAEVKDLREPLTEALLDEFALVDKALWQITGDSIEQPIWSDFTEQEMDQFVRVFLRAGQRSVLVATAARGATDLQDYIVAGAIVLPRLQKTAVAVREARVRRKNAFRN